MSIPVLKIYDENHNPIPIPAIRGEKGEKGDKGDKGDVGGITILGYYASAAALQAAVPSPAAGDTYGIGSAAPYDIYIWDAVNSRWVNNGSIQGAKGEKGDKGDNGADGTDGTDGADGVSVTNAVINSSGELVLTLSSGNTLNAGAAKGEAGAAGEKGNDGHTPVKGTDYWTAEDKAGIVADVLGELHRRTDIGLRIAAQLSEPLEATDNMIWIETETAVPEGKYMVSSQQPAAGLENGFVWIREMYLPKAEIHIPDSHTALSIAQVWQLENGEWIWKRAHVYDLDAEEWRDTGVYWFKAGTGFNTEVFGAVYISNSVKALIGENNSCINFSSAQVTVSMQNLIPAGKFKYLVVDAEITGGSDGLRVGVDDEYTGAQFLHFQELYNHVRTTTVIDISAVSTAFLPKCYLPVAGTSAKVYNLWLL